MTFNSLIEEKKKQEKQEKHSIPADCPVTCENPKCLWQGEIQNCSVEMESGGWEYPEYEIPCCPKCGEPVQI